MQLSVIPLRRKVRRSHVILLLLAGACAHDDPFDHQPPFEEGPHNPANPARLTYSSLEDQYAAWLPDGSGLIYSYDPGSNPARDRCLGILPAVGGQIRARRCYRSGSPTDSTDAYLQSAPRADGQIAWLETHGLAGRVTPDRGGLMLGGLNERIAPRQLQAVPYLASTGSIHATLLDLRWLSATQLAYIGADVVIRAPCTGCKPDTIPIPQQVMLLNTGGGAPTVLEDSDETTSIWPTADSTGIYYTVAGDTRVFRRQLAGGAPTLVHDFGVDGIVRDVSVVGDLLAAVVGGDVEYGVEINLGARQIDSGGSVMTVDLGTGNTTTTGDLAWFRRPVISPDGRSIVVEAIPRNRSNPNPDLWLFQVP